VTYTAGVRTTAHVTSEKKRRANINNGFDALRAAVPGIQTFHSKADVLRRAVSYIRALGPRRRGEVPADHSAPPTPMPLPTPTTTTTAVPHEAFATLDLMEEVQLAWLASGASVSSSSAAALAERDADLQRRLAMAMDCIERLRREREELRRELDALRPGGSSPASHAAAQPTPIFAPYLTLAPPAAPPERLPLGRSLAAHAMMLASMPTAAVKRRRQAKAAAVAAASAAETAHV
jgi:hypothetical protein